MLVVKCNSLLLLKHLWCKFYIETFTQFGTRVNMFGTHCRPLFLLWLWGIYILKLQLNFCNRYEHILLLMDLGERAWCFISIIQLVFLAWKWIYLNDALLFSTMFSHFFGYFHSASSLKKFCGFCAMSLVLQIKDWKSIIRLTNGK